MATSDRDRWDSKYAGKAVPTLTAPDDWLRQHAALLPVGHALDLACGLGHNAIWLAQQGWHVDAVDISPVGLALASRVAEQVGCLAVSWIAADLDTFEPGEGRYDLITVFRFLDRQRLPQLIETALRPGGILIYETFSLGQLSRPDNHLKSPQFALEPGELPTLFPRLTVMATEEIDLPDRSVARLVARKPGVAGKKLK